ncbi:MAG: YbaK/EbsC family protein [Salinisphaera sp.]|uniref:aminoacyl-tRNA deacylase n=1 Tax=Salinisphaera sp. TaxID=1914330 RepID=UPI003C7C050E
MPSQKLIEYLDREGVKYSVVHHSRAITASEIAQATHISGRNLAKTVVVDIDGRLAMAVLPATEQVHPDDLARQVGAKSVRLAKEYEFESRFPDCEIGAMPPLGNLYGLEVFVSSRLTADELIAFNAGTHEEVVQMPYSTFERLVNPVVLKF